MLSILKKPLLPAIAWLTITTILLVLPGSSFPQEDWLSKIWFDKWVHIGLFAVMTFLWGRMVRNNNSNISIKRKWILYVAVAVLLYGIGMEFIQKYFVPNRSFDNGDIAADAAGSFLGFLLYNRMYIKK
ncbi:MAG TPA: VanZ family protein [Chitinophagaceae bacterium]|nr:VanZ family protein [Chitinophagaceae bacterium]